ncbi:MAG: oligosaccharide flippase family protein [Oscillospiraceae bacterium]|nr:oligosaccharide flippase family protein [Oscillospiraceae bacterium]
MSRESKLAKNTVILAIGTFLPKLASFVTLPILTGCLTREDYGIYDLIVVMCSLFLPAITLQIQTAAFRFLIDERKNRKEVNSIITNIMIFLVCVSAVGLLILFFCLYKIDMNLRLMICLYYMFDIVVNSFRQIVRGLSYNLKYSISAIISSVFQLVLVVLLVWYQKHGLMGSMIALATAECASAVYLLFSTKLYQYFDFKTLSLAQIKKMLAYSWPMVPNNMSMWVMRMSDRVVVTLFMGLTANAVYSVANKIPQLLNMAQNTFAMAWQENASIVSKDEDADRYYSDMFRTMFDCMAGLLGLIIAANPILFLILIRGDYDGAYIHIPILLMSMFFYSMSSFLGGIYVAYMKTKSVGITTMIAAVVNIVMDMALIHFIGLFAASCSTLLSFILLFLYRLIDVKKYVKLTYDKKHIAVMILIMTAECVLVSFRSTPLDCLNALLAIVFFFATNRALLQAFTKKAKGILVRKHE